MKKKEKGMTLLFLLDMEVKPSTRGIGDNKYI